MYFGSVRFFKHLILLGLGLLIAVPAILCVVFGVENHALRAQAAVFTPPAVSLPPVAKISQPAPASEPDPAPEPTPAAETPEYQTLYPGFYAPAAQRGTVDTEKTAYLTFDDGPSAQTPKILEILAEYDVKATFFVVGKTDEQSKQRMRDIVAGGHTLGVHSYSHDYEKIYSSVEAFLEDYDRVFTLIEETTGVPPAVTRFPGGSINGYTGVNYRSLVAELVRRGFVYFDWNVATGDAAATGAVPADKLAENALARVDALRRAVVLMHDSAGKSTTVEALPAIIEGYRAAGFTLEPLTPEVAPVIYNYPD